MPYLPLDGGGPREDYESFQFETTPCERSMMGPISSSGAEVF